MHRSTLFFVLIALGGTAASAESCPPNPEINAQMDVLIEEIRRAPTEASARPFSNRMWELWLDAPDGTAQALLDEGIARLRVADHEGAEATLSRLVDYCPDYAEGYNQRAFSKFLRGDYGGALDDLELAIERSPRHVGALSGRALTLMGLGRTEAGQSALREALDINPWLSERSLLIEPPGEDL